MSERRRGAHTAARPDPGPGGVLPGAPDGIAPDGIAPDVDETDADEVTTDEAVDAPAVEESAVDEPGVDAPEPDAPEPDEHAASPTHDGPHRALHRRRTPWAGAAGVAIVLVLAGYLFAANARLAAGTDGRSPQDLPGLVEAEVERLEEAEAEVRELEAEVIRLTEAQTSDLPTLDPDVASREALAAGREAVTGPGLTVRLTDAPANLPQPAGVTNDDLVVHQQDLQAVINALWAAGAEAMTLQDQRVISTSAFRCVGNVLLLHGRQYSPPYVVQAVGDPDVLRRALLADPAIEEYLAYVEAVGLGWSTTVEDRLELPAYEGSTELQFATVPDDVEVLPASSGS